MKLFKLLKKSERNVERKDDIWQPQSLPFNVYQQVKIIKYGANHIVIVTKQDDLFVFGKNEFGELGLGDNKERMNNFTKIKKLFKIKFLECGNAFTIIVNNFNEFYFAGYFDYETSFNFKYLTNINLSTVTDKIKFIRCGTGCIFIVTENALYGYGCNDLGQLGIKNQLFVLNVTKIIDVKIKELQCGNNCTVFLDVDGTVYVCGHNKHGQLGISDDRPKVYSEFLKLSYFTNFKGISCFSYGMLLLNGENMIYAAGNNAFGQLGMKRSFIKRNVDIFTEIKSFNSEHLSTDSFERVLTLYKSFGNYNLISDSDNNIYVTGSNVNDALGISSNNDKEIAIYQFTEMDCGGFCENLKNKFIYPLLLEEQILMIVSDYCLNKSNYLDDYLQQQLFMQNKDKFNDIVFFFNFTNT